MKKRGFVVTVCRLVCLTLNLCLVFRQEDKIDIALLVMGSILIAFCFLVVCGIIPSPKSKRRKKALYIIALWAYGRYLSEFTPFFIRFVSQGISEYGQTISLTLLYICFPAVILSWYMKNIYHKTASPMVNQEPALD